MNEGTIQLHFSGKEELILSHIDRIASRLREIAASSTLPGDRRERMLAARVLDRFDSVSRCDAGQGDSSPRSK